MVVAMTNRPFIGARIEEALTRRLNRILARRGWVNSIIPFYGYGSQSRIRVLARVVLAPPLGRTILGRVADDFLSQRGWRNFIGLPSPRSEVGIDLPGGRQKVRSDRGGYVDLRFPNPGLTPGWHEVALHGPGDSHSSARVLVVGPDQDFGLISDIDDTVISTSLPRLLIAAWNSFVRTEQARQPIPGMARMYQRLLADHPDAPVIYVSTGAWNTYPFLTRFLARHGYPTGPLLLTDWGPTNTGWFRSGTDHKREAMREVARAFPNVRWVLVGDDGQHDVALYTEFDRDHPDRVRAIAIRELTPTEQVLAHGTAAGMEGGRHRLRAAGPAPLVRAPDGDLLYPPLRSVLARAGQDGD
jgi:phosphatidate phosphatase APP1